MLIDFCRYKGCLVRSVLDNKDDRIVSNERRKEIEQGCICKSCDAWKYELYRLENE